MKPTAAVLSKVPAGVMLLGGVFGVPFALMALLGDSLPEDSVGVLGFGGLMMAVGLHMRIKQARDEQ